MRNLLLLFLVIILAVFLRFFQVSSNPPSLTWDEAAWGYNAYSIGVDGRDEFGKFLPLTYLESFGDFKPPVYAYLSVLPVKLLGLNEFSTRFASAFFGVLTVLLTYFITKQIFLARSLPHVSNDVRRTHVEKSSSFPPSLSESRYIQEKGISKHKTAPTLNSFENGQTVRLVALLSAGLLAISPWHILLSRAAFEANVATFFTVLGVYLFLESNNRKWMLPASIISFVISMYTFNTARIVSPLLLLGLVFMNRKFILLDIRKQTIVSLIIGGLIFLPLFLFLITPQARLRFHEVNIFSDSSVVERANQQMENDGNTFWSRILHNRRLGYAAEYLKHYFDNLSPDFLFIKGDGNPKFSIRDVGQLYIWELPFLIAGTLFLFKRKEGHWWVIPYWLIIGIIPAGAARETPHALRIETTLPTFQILTAYGIVCLWQTVSSIKYQVLSMDFRKAFIFLLVITVTFNFLYFYHNYFKHYPKEFSAEWQYGYQEAITYTKENEDKFEKIIFTEDLGRPYIYVLFYTQYNPAKFREEAKVEREVLGFVHVRSFGKYKFVKDVSDNIDRRVKTLYIDSPNEVPSDAKILKSFNLLDGIPVLVAYSYE